MSQPGTPGAAEVFRVQRASRLAAFSKLSAAALATLLFLLVCVPGPTSARALFQHARRERGPHRERSKVSAHLVAHRHPPHSEPRCPTVYVYDAPELWDFPIPFAQLHRADPAAIVGKPCGDGTFDTEQYAMAMLVLYRLAASTRCRVTKDPAEAELFVVPAFPAPKRGAQIGDMCERGEALEQHLPHLSPETAPRHLLMMSKGHSNAKHCDWWRQPRGLLTEATRVSYSVVVRGEWDDDDAAPAPGPPKHAAYGPFDGPDWPLSRLTAARDYDDSSLVYPHAFSVPYPSDVHWGADGGVGPWARVDRPRRFMASFLGDIHGKYGVAVRQRIVEVCKAAGEPACLHANMATLSKLQKQQAKHAKKDDSVVKGHCRFKRYKQDAIFCLEPGGDSPYRKSLSDDIAMGCIPVVFSPYLQLVDPWHWDHFRNDSHVYINREDFLEGRLDLFDVLQRLVDSGEARRMQHVIARHGHAFQYSLHDYPGDAVERLLVGAAREAERRERRMAGSASRSIVGTSNMTHTVGN
eukprot:jgi/Tetstr1/432253/TSEL_002288.t1